MIPSKNVANLACDTTARMTASPKKSSAAWNRCNAVCLKWTKQFASTASDSNPRLEGLSNFGVIWFQWWLLFFLTLTNLGQAKLHVDSIRHIDSFRNFALEELLNLTIRWNWDSVPFGLGSKKKQTNWVATLAQSHSMHVDLLVSLITLKMT